MSKRKWKKYAFLILGGGVLFQSAGCLAIFGPVATSLIESTILTFLLGAGR